MAIGRALTENPQRGTLTSLHAILLSYAEMGHPAIARRSLQPSSSCWVRGHSPRRMGLVGTTFSSLQKCKLFGPARVGRYGHNRIRIRLPPSQPPTSGAQVLDESHQPGSSGRAQHAAPTHWDSERAPARVFRMSSVLGFRLTVLPAQAACLPRAQGGRAPAPLPLGVLSSGTIRSGMRNGSSSSTAG